MRNSLTFLELILVVFIVAILCIVFLFEPLDVHSRTISLRTECTFQLSHIGKALFQYESPESFGNAPYLQALPLRNRNTPEQAFLPLQTLRRAGLLTDPALLCPAVEKPLAILTQEQLANPAGQPPAGYTHYLFTYYYQQESFGSRVIAGDTSGDPAPGKGYSPNHGDSSRTSQARFGGANALFKDGHVKCSTPDYTVEGAQQPGNASANTADLWDASGVIYNPETDSATGAQISPLR